MCDEEKQKLGEIYKHLLANLEPLDILEFFNEDFLPQQISSIKNNSIRQTRVVSLFNGLLEIPYGYSKLIVALDSAGYFSQDHPNSLSALHACSCQSPRASPRARPLIEQFYLNNFSILSLFPQIPSTRVPIDDIWVNLHLQHGFGRRPTDDYLQCFAEALSTERPLVIKGEPGVGKSTLVKRICHDWAMGHLPQYDLVVVARFREVSLESQAQNLVDVCARWLAQRVPGLTEDHLVKYVNFLLNRGDRILVLMDGLDEFSHDWSLLEESIQSVKRMYNADIVITSRPYKISVVQCEYQLVNIRGFSITQIRSYIARFFSNPEQQEGARRVLNAIESSFMLQDVARIPLLLHLMCLVGSCFPETEALTMTNLYLALCEWLVTNHNHNHPSSVLQAWPRSNEIKKLGGLAFDGLLADEEGRLVFHARDLEKFKVDDLCFQLGFLNNDTVTSDPNHKESGITFFHKTGQEFFAGLRLAREMAKIQQIIRKGEVQENFDLEEFKKSLFHGEKESRFPFFTRFFRLVEEDSSVLVQHQQVVAFALGLSETIAEPVRDKLQQCLTAGMCTYMHDTIALFGTFWNECRDPNLKKDLQTRIKQLRLGDGSLLDLVSAHRFSSDDVFKQISKQVFWWGKSFRQSWILINEPGDLDYGFSLETATVDICREKKPTAMWYCGKGHRLAETATVLLSAGMNLERLKMELVGAVECSDGSEWPALADLRRLDVDIRRVERANVALSVITEAVSVVLDHAEKLKKVSILGGKLPLSVISLCKSFPKSLTDLSFHFVSMNSDDIHCLVRNLYRIPKLCRLELNYCDLPMIAKSSIINQLYSTSLKPKARGIGATIFRTKAKPSPEQASAEPQMQSVYSTLLKALREKTTIQKLGLNGNKSLGKTSEFRAFCSELKHWKCLKLLSLNDIDFSYELLGEELENALGFLYNSGLSLSLARNRNLTQQNENSLREMCGKCQISVVF